MRTQTKLTGTQKIINIDQDTKIALTHQAVGYGLSLKAYIEQILHNIAEMEEDRYLGMVLKSDDNDPDNYILNAKEKEEFEKKLLAAL